MDRYICLCGKAFKNNKAINAHVKMYKDSDFLKEYPRHGVFKVRWHALVLAWFSRILK